MGITEPAMYGVNMRLKKPFAAALIGGATGGAFYGMTGVASYIVGGNAGLPSIPVFIGPTFIYAIIGLVIAFAAGTALRICLDSRMCLLTATSDRLCMKAKREIIHSPIKGEVKALSEVNDGVFSAGIMGKGFAIEPEEGEVVSPVHGSVTTILKQNMPLALRVIREQKSSYTLDWTR